MLHANRRRLQRERFRLGKGRLPFLRILRLVVFAVLGFVDGIVVVVEVGCEGGGHGCLVEARGVRRGLGAELGEVEV